MTAGALGLGQQRLHLGQRYAYGAARCLVERAAYSRQFTLFDEAINHGPGHAQLFCSL